MNDSKHPLEKDSCKEIKYTEEELVKKYEARLPPPSPNLRFSIQLIAHNEMPGDEEYHNPRGNLAEWLYAVFNSIEYYKKTDEGDGDVEILVNVNNDENEMFYNPITGEAEVGTKANYRSLLLLKNLNAYAKDEISLEEALAFIDWITPKTSISIVPKGNLRLRSMFSNDNDAGESHHDNETYRTVYQFYKRLFKLGKEVLNNGTQLHAIDCTHGEFIHEMNYEEEIERFESSNQFVRRHLIGTIGLHRLEQVATANSLNPAELVILMTDADTRYDRRFIAEVFENFSGKQTEARLVIPFRLVREISSELQETTFPVALDLLNMMLLATMRFCAKKASSPSNPLFERGIPAGLWSLPIQVINILAYKANKHPPFERSQSNDEELISTLERNKTPTFFLDEPRLTIIDRISSDSFMGEELERLERFKWVLEDVSLDKATYLMFVNNERHFIEFINNLNHKHREWKGTWLSRRNRLNQMQILRGPLLLNLLNVLQAVSTKWQDILTEQEKRLINKYIINPGKLYNAPSGDVLTKRFRQSAIQLAYIRWLSLFRELAGQKPAEFPHLFDLASSLPQYLR